MAQARRRSLRQQAFDIARLMSFSGKLELDRFLQTGSLEEHVRPAVPMTPAYVAALERIQRIKAERLEGN